MRDSLKFFFLALPVFCKSLIAETVEAVVVHPVFNEYYSCRDHWRGQFKELGDALGADCHVLKIESIEGRSFPRLYKTNGLTNEDWFGWRAEVRSPFDGEIVKVYKNDVTNAPGVMGKGQASLVKVRRKDGLIAVLAHLDDFSVKLNEKVKTGQILGHVGNNGESRMPHIHIGLYKDKVPYQIRFDQNLISR